MNTKIYKVAGNLGLRKADIDKILSNNDVYKAGTHYGTVCSTDLYKAGTDYGTVSPKDIYKAGTWYGSISPKDF